jgi:hypothetical protein
VTPGDDESLAVALGRIAGDRELGRELGLRGRKLVVEKFDTVVMVKAAAARFDTVFEL